MTLVAAGSPEDRAQAMKDAARFLLARLAWPKGRDDQGRSAGQSIGKHPPLGT